MALIQHSKRMQSIADITMSMTVVLCSKSAALYLQVYDKRYALHIISIK